MKWDRFKDRIPVRLEWLDEKQGRVIVSDQFEITFIEGIQPRWNGAQIEWKREGGGNIDFVSRQLEKFFNGDNKTGSSAQTVFRLDKPAGANFLRIIIDKPGVASGSFEIESLAIDAEY